METGEIGSLPKSQLTKWVDVIPFFESVYDPGSRLS